MTQETEDPILQALRKIRCDLDHLKARLADPHPQPSEPSISEHLHYLEGHISQVVRTLHTIVLRLDRIEQNLTCASALPTTTSSNPDLTKHSESSTLSESQNDSDLDPPVITPIYRVREFTDWTHQPGDLNPESRSAASVQRFPDTSDT
jgi:signal transduction histidine kinase